MNIRPLPYYGMFIQRLITNHWSVILLLALPPQRWNQFQYFIYLNLWEWKTQYHSDTMNKFYYDAKTETLYPKLNRRYKDINQIIKESTIDFSYRSRSSVSWGSFFMRLFMLMRYFSTSLTYRGDKERDHYIIQFLIQKDIKKFLRILQTPERFHNFYGQT